MEIAGKSTTKQLLSGLPSKDIMENSTEEQIKNLNEMQASRGLDPETRQLIGILLTTIQSLDQEIGSLQQRITKLEEIAETQQKRAWYSERK